MYNKTNLTYARTPKRTGGRGGVGEGRQMHYPRIKIFFLIIRNFRIDDKTEKFVFCRFISTIMAITVNADDCEERGRFSTVYT